MSETKWLDNFGDNLSNMLEEYNMSQRELALETGLSESSISRYIHKQKIPSIKALINISVVLDCSIDDLIYFGEKID